MPNPTTLKQIAQTSGLRLVSSTELYPAQHAPGDAGLPMLVVDNALGRAVIALQGAHLMSFVPAGQTELFWVSPKTALKDATPIRAGIPLCLPWFGPGPDGKSMHGFARTAEWTLVEASLLDSGETELAFELSGDANTNALWPHAFVFRLDVRVGKTLTLGLTATNTGAQDAPLAFAFHSYFAVPNVAAAHVGGLEGTTYIDKMDNFARKPQKGEVVITGTTDRIYLDVPAQQTVRTAAGDILVESDARCAVVWNAWTNDKNIADLGEGNHVGYLCVERGDVADYAVTIAPGARYRTWMILARA